MKPSHKYLMLLAVALLLLGAAGCTQSKPAVPTATLAPLNATPLLPATTSETPAFGGGTSVPGGGESTPGSATPLPTPTSPLGAQATPVLPPPLAQATAVPNPPSQPSAGGACSSPYTVQRGEWIYSIARKCGVAPGALIAANPGINPNLVVAGMRLIIPGGGGGAPPAPPGGGGRTYTVAPGDTLYSIAVKFNTTVAALMQANGLSNPNFVFPGQVLTIP